MLVSTPLYHLRRYLPKYISTFGYYYHDSLIHSVADHLCSAKL